MVGQGASRRLAAREGGNRRIGRHLVGGLDRGERLLDIFQRQLELTDHGAGLRGLAERLAARLRQLEAQPLQFEIEHDAVYLCLGDGGLRRQPRLAFREDHRVRGGEVFRHRLRERTHPTKES